MKLHTENNTLHNKKQNQRIRKFVFKSATFNVRTASSNERLGLICKELNGAGVIVGGLPEARIMGKGMKTIILNDCKFDVYYCGRETSREHGVAICLKRSIHIEVEHVEWVNERLIAVDCRIAGVKFRVVSAYAPQNGRDVAEKTAFYHELEQLICSKDCHRKVLLLGDFNAYCSAFHEKCNFSGHDVDSLGEYESHESGELFLDFLMENKMGSLASYFQHKWLHTATHYNNNGSTVRVYDFIVCSDWLRKFTLDCRVRNNVSIDSDHRCLVAVHAVPRFKRDRKLTGKTKKAKKQEPKRDFGLLRKNEELGNDFIQKFVENVQDIDNPTIEDIQLGIEKSSEIIPLIAKNTQKVRPWDTDLELVSLIETRRKIDRSTDKSEFKKLTKKIKKRVSKLRENHLITMAGKINLQWRMRELEKMYKSTKDDGYGCEATLEKRCSDEDLTTHFSQHFNRSTELPPPPEITTDIPDCISKLGLIQFDDSSIHDSPPTTDELVDSIMKLKNGRSSTDAPAECLKCLVDNQNFMSIVQAAIAQVWTTLEIPEKWRVSRLVALFKKGDATLAVNYRGLSVSSVMLKAAMIVILNRQKKWYEHTLDDCQNGFREDRGTIDSTMIVKSLNRVAKSRNEQIYCLALDLRAAYDWLIRSWLWTNMDARNSRAEYRDDMDKMYKLVRAMYDETYAYVGDEANKFRTTSGVLQGAVESPANFSIFFDTILRIFMDECAKNNILGVEFDYQIPSTASTRIQRMQDKLHGTRNVFYAGYCDDVFAMFSSLEDLKGATVIMENICKRFGLTICTKKTKTMILNWQEPIKPPQTTSTTRKTTKKSKPKSTYPKTLLKIDGVSIDNVSTFKYLGIKLDKSDYKTGKSEINHRISCARYKFKNMDHIFKNKNIKMKVRIIYYNAYIRTRLCYGCQLWNLPEILRGKVRSVHTKHLRTMIRGGFDRRGGDLSLRDEIGYNWAYVNSYKKLLDIGKTDPVLNFSDFQRSKWISHLIRKNNDSTVKQLLFEKSQITRVGRTTSSLDQLLKVTRQYEMSDDMVYKSSVNRDFVGELKDRDFEFVPSIR